MKKYTYNLVKEPSSEIWHKIESCYDGTVDKTPGIMDYVQKQGAKPFISEVILEGIVIGYFVGEIVKRGVNILASPTLGLGIAHQGLSMLNVVEPQERIGIYKQLAKWVFKKGYAWFIEIEDFQLEMADLEADGEVKFDGHDTSWVDLTQSEEVLLKGMHYKSCRYMINKAIKNGITIREAEDSEKFLDLHFEQHLEVMSRHGKNAAKPKCNLKWLIDSTINSSLMLLEAVDKDGNVIVTAMFNANKNNCHFFSRACYSNELSSGANELIMWEAMKKSKAMGATYFNNSGVGPFKLKFGSVRRYKPRIFFERVPGMLSARKICFDIYHKYRHLFSKNNNN